MKGRGIWSKEKNVEKGLIAKRNDTVKWQVRRPDGSFVAQFSSGSELAGLDEIPCEVESRPGVAEVGIRFTGMMFVRNEREES